VSPELLCAGSNNQKAARPQIGALHNFTDFKPDAFRENATGSTAYELRQQL
jgi:hypothetical protein